MHSIICTLRENDECTFNARTYTPTAFNDTIDAGHHEVLCTQDVTLRTLHKLFHAFIALDGTEHHKTGSLLGL